MGDQTRFVFETEVVRVFHHEPLKSARKVKDPEGGPDTVEHVTEDQGWFVALRGSWEALGLGFDKPDLAPGDKMRVSLEKVP